jgi:hypothetical protein
MVVGMQGSQWTHVRWLDTSCEYIGETCHELRPGKGCIYDQDGSVYVGTWYGNARRGDLTGQGLRINPIGQKDVLEGSWCAGVWHGMPMRRIHTVWRYQAFGPQHGDYQGKYYHPRGDSGRGCIILSSQEILYGKFYGSIAQGTVRGFGWLIKRKENHKSVYSWIGCISNGVLHGSALGINFRTGSSYIGGIEQGKFSGKGCLWTQVWERKGEFRQGELVEGSLVSSRQTRYSGRFHRQDGKTVFDGVATFPHRKSTLIGRMVNWEVQRGIHCGPICTIAGQFIKVSPKFSEVHGYGILVRGNMMMRGIFDRGRMRFGHLIHRDTVEEGFFIGDGAKPTLHGRGKRTAEDSMLDGLFDHGVFIQGIAHSPQYVLYLKKLPTAAYLWVGGGQREYRGAKQPCWGVFDETFRLLQGTTIDAEGNRCIGSYHDGHLQGRAIRLSNHCLEYVVYEAGECIAVRETYRKISRSHRSQK